MNAYDLNLGCSIIRDAVSSPVLARLNFISEAVFGKPVLQAVFFSEVRLFCKKLFGKIASSTAHERAGISYYF